MDFSHAFSPMRAFKHGYEALRMSFAPLFVGGLILSLIESGGGGGGSGDPSAFEDLLNGGSGGYYDDYDWGGGGSDWNYRLQQLGETIGVEDLGSAVAGQGLGGLAGLAKGELEPALIGGILVGAFCFLVLIVVFMAVQSWISVGWIRLHEQVIVEGEGNFGTLFGGGDRFMDMLLWRLLKGVILTGVMLAAFIPGAVVLGAGAGLESQELMVVGGVLMFVVWVPAAIYVMPGLTLGDQALVLEKLGPTDTLSRSWALADGNRWTLIVYAFLMSLAKGIAGFVGIMMCCVGWFFTMPCTRAIVDVGWTESFLFHTRGEEEASKWRLPEVAGGLY